jgi:cell division protein FtsI/penicillin-binding protein 2
MMRAARREPAVDWRLTLAKRSVVAAGFFALWAVGIEARLVYLQVYKRADLVARAERQQMRTIEAPAKRGDILDRKGHVLATSVDADSIYAVPSEIGNADEAATRLCTAFVDCTPKERQALAERLRHQRYFTFVRRQVSPEEARRVADLNLDGVGFIKESKRFYPNRELAAHLLGWVGIDNSGLSGLESTYDSQISGKKGTILIQTDARRHAFSRFERPPTSGSTVELTIDEYIQHVAERELHAGIVENRAASGSAIVMIPRTGEILAVANEPTFNPNLYRDSQDFERRNRAVQDLYEPGSTFKVVTASAAIEEAVLPIDSLIDTNPGQIRLAGRPPIREDGGRNYGVLSFTDVIVKSSNIGAIKIGFRVGTERLSRFVQRYGFGHTVSPDFPAENPGIVWDSSKWTESALASVSMGYQVAVTPLQMVAAVSSVANGGDFVEPRVIRAIYRGNLRYVVQPKVLRRTIRPDTAAALTNIMENVVERGTGKRARIPGFTIAGKTGTAAQLIGGHYSHSDYNASFVGFCPSRDPQIAIIVVVNAPHGPNGNHGGSVSAPIFKRIAQATLTYLGVAPSINPAPPVLIARRSEWDETSTEEPPASNEPTDPTAPSVGSGFSPTATSNRTSGSSNMNLVVGDPPTTLPDLRGMSAREAVRKLATLGLTARISGDGFVASQDPPAGESIEPGGVCRLVLDRPLPRIASGSLQP